ncbi:hypothetical protein [Primorskyibacter sp. S87]|uniref:hypothetical protein n=1 Tax=Primorskyibacter sp. S87 TaxID=3415126 RepID=UPI003C7C9A60
MDRNELSRRMVSGPVVFYRRVSTKAQAEGDFRHQLRALKVMHPRFRITADRNLDLKEVISGYASPEKRMAGKLGVGLKFLHRNPDAIMVVTEADRIARKAEIFERIDAQGLGGRVVDLSSGETVSDIIRAGKHKKIEEQFLAHRKACRTGIRRYQQSGGVLGRKEIARESQKGSARAQAIACERRDDVLRVVGKLAIENRGRRSSLAQVGDRLKDLGIRTGQGLFFTPLRLTQFKKRHGTKWRYAEDSYRRPRMRIRRKILSFQIETRRKRNASRRVARLDNLTRFQTRIINRVRPADTDLSSHHPYFNHIRHSLPVQVRFQTTRIRH